MVDRSTIEAPHKRASARSDTGGWLSRGLNPLFQRVKIEDEASQRLTEAYARGNVIHVFRASRLTDPLYLLYALRRLGLPRPRWMHDHHASLEENSTAALAANVIAGHSAVLFLRRPRTLLSPSGAYPEQHVEALLRLQTELDRPILLLPETLLWTKRPVGLRRTVVDSIFGDREAPGWARELVGFLWNYGDARFHVGAPVDLRSLLEREAGVGQAVVARKLRWVILHHLSREEQLRTGPMARTMARTRQAVLKDQAIRRYFAQQEAKGKKTKDLERKAKILLRGIAADMRYGWLRVLDAVADVIWHRMYDGIVVDQEGLTKVRRAARSGPVVLIPSHKSHIDYMVLSQVFFKDGLMPPLVAAGENLNFWPIGFIFRRSGAFFIRRTFGGDKMYPLVFAAYVRRLLKEGHALEFFIEGGRSRTGKLLPPRTGMLSMCVEPVLEGNIADVAFIPVSISYEKIVEASAYAKELAGDEKRKEDARGLLSSAGLLRSKYGRVYVDFAEPISLRAFAESRGIRVGSEEPSEALDRKDLVTQLGHKIVYGINEVTRATPTSVAALVLLARPVRGLGEEELYSRAGRSIMLLEELGARVSTMLEPETRQAALKEALERFVKEGKLQIVAAPDGDTVFQLNDAGRQALDYYKNNVLHFLVPSAVVSLALLVQSNYPTSEMAVSASALRISKLLKHEFSFRVDRAFEDNFKHAAQTLGDLNILRVMPDGWRLDAANRTTALELAGLLAPFFEAYRVSVMTLDRARDKAMAEKKFIALALGIARRQVIDGRLSRAEAAVQPTLKNAVAVLKDEGIIARTGGVRMTDIAKRDAMVEELSTYLRASRD